MNPGEHCPGCADQAAPISGGHEPWHRHLADGPAAPISGGGNRMVAFKPLGERGPTVYRDMTGIDEAHIEKLSGIQPFLATEGTLYDSTSGDGLVPLFRERPLGGNAIAFLGDVPDAAMSPQVKPSGMSKDEEEDWENCKWKERDASDAASRADMAATSVERPPRRSRGVQSEYGTPDGRNRRQLPAYPDDVFELACGHSHRFASQVKLTVKREARGTITVPLPADVTADDLLRAQGDDPRDYKTEAAKWEILYHRALKQLIWQLSISQEYRNMQDMLALGYIHPDAMPPGWDGVGIDFAITIYLVSLLRTLANKKDKPVCEPPCEEFRVLVTYVKCGALELEQPFCNVTSKIIKRLEARPPDDPGDPLGPPMSRYLEMTYKCTWSFVYLCDVEFQVDCVPEVEGF